MGNSHPISFETGRSRRSNHHRSDFDLACAETLICGKKLGKDNPISFAKKYYIRLNISDLPHGCQRAYSTPIRRGKEYWGDHGVSGRQGRKE
jgi:hypothetical protein